MNKKILSQHAKSVFLATIASTCTIFKATRNVRRRSGASTPSSLPGRQFGIWLTLLVPVLLSACGHAPYVKSSSVININPEKIDTLSYAFYAQKLKKSVSSYGNAASVVRPTVVLSDSGFNDIGRWTVENAPQVFARHNITIAETRYLESDDLSTPQPIQKDVNGKSLPLLLLTPLEGTITGNGHATVSSHTFRARLLIAGSKREIWNATVQTGSWRGDDAVLRNIKDYSYNEAYAVQFLEALIQRMETDGLLSHRRPVITAAAAPAPAPVPVPQIAATESKPALIKETERVAMPIFNNVLVIEIPVGMSKTTELSETIRYRSEFLAADETSGQWSRKMTISGIKGAAQNTIMTLDSFAENLALDIQKECKGTFSQKTLSSGEINGYERQVLVVSCAAHKLSEQYVNDSTLISIVKDKDNYYALEWKERLPGTATDLPAIRPARWADVYRRIGTIQPCRPAPGENTPYQSCLSK